jgi:hypothetical protein
MKMTGERKRPGSLGLAVTLSAIVILAMSLVSLTNFFPLTFQSRATMVVGLTRAQQSDLIAGFCATMAHEANRPTGRVALTTVVADAILNYADHHRAEVDLKTAHAMMHGALAAEPQNLTIAKMCATAGHLIVSLNPEVQRPVSAATSAAAGP